MKTKIKFSITANKMWLINIIRNLALEQKNSYNYSGKIPSKYSSCKSLDINIYSKGFLYEIEIKGNLNSWYSKNDLQDFTRPKFINCIDILSQKLSIKKSVLMNAKIKSLIFGSPISIEKKEIYYNRIESLSTFVNQNPKHGLILEKIDNKKTIQLSLNIKCNFRNGKLSYYSVNNVKDVILTWNMIVAYWEEQVKLLLAEFINEDKLSNIFCELIIKKNILKATKLKDEMRYEDEVKCYFIGLPSVLETQYYIDCEDIDTLEGCIWCYTEALELSKHPRTIKQLNNRLEKIDHFFLKNNLATNINQ